jgi:sugar transferase (PEP-CTERM/EpsH1 system associated)
VIYRLDFGGLENGLVNLINYLPAERFRHAVICITHATDFRLRIERSDVEIIELGKRDGKDLATYGRMWRAIRALQPDIVHTRNLPALDMLAPTALAGVRRFVHSEHGLDVIELDSYKARYLWLRRISQFLVRRYITVSRDLETWLNREALIAKEKIAVIYNGVDTMRFHPGDPPPNFLPLGFAPLDAFVIGTVGRLEAVKDQLLLARAFCRLLDLDPALRSRARLVIVGDGSLRAEIENMLSGANLRELAWLPGFRSNAEIFYRAFDVFVLPSRREGISNTVLEAMASGLPVVATHVGGNPEIVLSSTGQLVPAGDPDAMARALMRYIRDPNLAGQQGRAGLARAETGFSLPAMMQSYMEVYDNL